MKYLITIPHAKAHKAPKLIEYICSFSEIENNFLTSKELLIVETKRDLRWIKKYQNYAPSPGVSKKVLQLLDSIDINTLAD